MSPAMDTPTFRVVVVEANSGELLQAFADVGEAAPHVLQHWIVERVDTPESAFRRLSDAVGPQGRVDAIALDPWAGPGADRWRIVERIRQRFPGVRVIVASTRLRDSAAAASGARSLTADRFGNRVLQIELPCAPVELLQLLETIAGGTVGTGAPVTSAGAASADAPTGAGLAPLQWTSAVEDASGVSSRWTLERALQELLRDAKRSGGVHCACVIAVDRCRPLLDPRGAAARESALRQVRDRIVQFMPRGTCIGMLADGAIGICLPRTPLAEARRLAEAAIAVIRASPVRVANDSLTLTASAGLARIEARHATALDTLRSASIALDVAAGSAGDRVCEFRDDDPEVLNRLSLEQSLPEIEAALNEQRFALYAQLIVPTQGRGPVHAEMLLRMVGRDGSIKSPATFIAAAERYGIVGRIDYWVLDHVLALLTGWTHAPASLGHVSVNLSGLTLNDPAALAWIEERVADAQLAPGRLCIEITETAALGQSTAVASFIGRLQARGVCFSLDDFGAGFSSFTYLESVPADLLKIDGSLVRGVNGQSRREQLLRAVNDVGHLFGKQTVAEFVEDAATMDLVTGLGVDFAQGYFIGRPFPVEHLPVEISRWLGRVAAPEGRVAAAGG